MAQPSAREHTGEVVRTEPIDKWVRGRLDGEVVVESREPLLVWQGMFPPVYAFRRDEIADGVLSPTDPPVREGFSFFAPQLPVSQWYDVAAAGRVLPAAAWTLADEAVADRVVLTWEPGLLEWTEEDEPVTGHPRDPHKRVEAIASSRRVEVAVDGVTLASSDRPVLLFETDLPTRFYLPAEDVRLDLLRADRQRLALPLQGPYRRLLDLAGAARPGQRRLDLLLAGTGGRRRRRPGGVLQRAGGHHRRRGAPGAARVTVQLARAAARRRRLIRRTCRPTSRLSAGVSADKREVPRISGDRAASDGHPQCGHGHRWVVRR